jgi:hypothetical protein
MSRAPWMFGLICALVEFVYASNESTLSHAYTRDFAPVDVSA